MDPDHTAAEFQTTHWSLVYGARGDRAHLEQLLRQYWSPVYAFIRRQGYGGHDASDLTQDFLAQVVIGRDLVGKADASRGRFRSFLKQALRNFLIDQHRSGRHHRGGGGTAGGGGGAAGAGGAGGAGELTSAERARGIGGAQRPLPLTDASGEVSYDPMDPRLADELSREFDREWAATIVQHTLTRMEEACRREGLQVHWEAFAINILGPALRKTRAEDLTTLAARLGVKGSEGAMQVSNMLQTMKRRFRRMLREVVSETVTTPDQVEAELEDLRGYMG